MVFLLLGIAASGLLLQLAVRALERVLWLAAAERGLGEGGLGLAAAVVADAPELVTASVALAGGKDGLAQGVLIGACALNLAGVVGVGAALAPTREGARAARHSVAAFLGIAATLCAGLGGGGRAGAAVLLGAGGLALVLLGDGRWVWPRIAGTGLARLVVGSTALIAASWALVGLLAALGREVGLAGRLTGVLLLAPVTAAPNLYAGLALARSGRWRAATAECFASNGINLLFGLALEAVAVGHGLAFAPLAALAAASAVGVWASERGSAGAGAAVIPAAAAVLLAAALAG